MRRHFWIPLTLLLLVPVPVVLLSHHTVEGYGQGGELILGIAALDSVLAEADGRPVLLNFWATWCAPCVRELPELEHLQRELQGDAVFLAVDIGDPDLSTLSSFLENRPVGLTVVWLNPSEAQTVSARYGLPDALPVTIVLDGGGEESRRAVGARSGEWFSAALYGASAGEPLPPEEEIYIHVYVVGPPGDPLTGQLAAEANRLAGDNVDILDPTLPGDSLLMEEAYLPMTGWPYAQLCVGLACSPPVITVSDLADAYEGMR